MRRQFISHAISAIALVTLGFCPADAADTAAGKAKAEVCAGCHGENGISQTENIPSLAGQPDQFLQWQLVFFRAGSRKNDQMHADRRRDQQRGHPQSRGLLLAARAAEGAGRPGSRSVEERHTSRGRSPLCLMPHGHLRGHQGRRAPRRPARGISREGAARLQGRPARRRRRRRDGRCRLRDERRRDYGGRALSGAFAVAPHSAVIPDKRAPSARRSGIHNHRKMWLWGLGVTTSRTMYSRGYGSRICAYACPGRHPSV
ncbi:hypothetical protein ACVI3S_008201 [Bradyrhizobium diazoefficiens]